LAVGAHAYVEAAGTAVAVALILVLLGRAEDFLFKRRTAITLEVVLDPDDALIDEIADQLRRYSVRALPLKVEKQVQRYRVSYELRGGARKRDEAVSEVAALEGVRRITVH
jgi:hypothetical protein